MFLALLGKKEKKVVFPMYGQKNLENLSLKKGIKKVTHSFINYFYRIKVSLNFQESKTIKYSLSNNNN